MLTDRGLRKVHVFDEVAHPVLARRQVLDQGQARGLCEGVEQRGWLSLPSKIGSSRRSFIVMRR